MSVQALKKEVPAARVGRDIPAAREDYVWSEQQRVGCAVGGVYTALAIERVLPIMHCGPGCQGNENSVLASTNGGQNADTYLESVIPSTNFCEADVVFGGQERLRKLVDESIRFYDADLFVVVDGCTAEIVGDDIEEVARDFSDAGAPVIHAALPGFKGNNVWGHSRILNAIIDQYLPSEAPEKVAKRVNVFGVVPYYDTFWVATLERLEQLLKDIGLEPNIIYGRKKGLEAVDRIPSAGFNLVISPWVDLDVAQKLEDKYGTPFLHYPVMPIGPTETGKFIKAVVNYANLDRLAAERYIREAEDRYYYYVNHFIRWIFTCRVQPKEFFINSSASQALSLTRFLINDLGFLPRKIFVNEDVPEEYRERIGKYFRDVEYADADGIDVVFTADGGLCDQYVKNEDTTFRKTVVLGTTWDELTAKMYKIPFVSVSSPYGDKIVGMKNYFGYDGGFSLLSDIYNDAAEKGMGTVN
jgi:nitrogenase molybdenum-iron protein beta chain